MHLSIILPVLNEDKNLSRTLKSLQSYRKQGHEIIVVDGRSEDTSMDIARALADHTLQTNPGRARQMNAGAAIATGDLLLFLHADTRLPGTAIDQIQALFDKQQSAANLWGRFDVRLSSDKIIFRVVEKLINLRSRLFSIATGDQAIFIQASLFRRINGFPEIDLMEDIAISRRLRRHTSAACLSAQVITSSRRWEKQGVIATIVLMWKLRLLYFIGISPSRLAKMYYPEKFS